MSAGSTGDLALISAGHQGRHPMAASVLYTPAHEHTSTHKSAHIYTKCKKLLMGLERGLSCYQVLLLLGRTCVRLPMPTSVVSEPSASPALGNPMPLVSMGTYTHMHVSVHTHISILLKINVKNEIPNANSPEET